MEKKSEEKLRGNQVHIESEVQNCIADNLRILTEDDKEKIIDYLHSISEPKCT